MTGEIFHLSHCIIRHSSLRKESNDKNSDVRLISRPLFRIVEGNLKILHSVNLFALNESFLQS